MRLPLSWAHPNPLTDLTDADFELSCAGRHPDRGGSPGAFLLVQHAYRRLMDLQSHAEGEEAVAGDVRRPPRTAERSAQEKPEDHAEDGSPASLAMLEGPKLDAELREHRALVEQLFHRDGTDRDARISAGRAALAELGLMSEDVGATNKNEQGELMYNQCFYLSLARSFLRDDGRGRPPARRAIEDTALHFKRVIEAAVLRVHPEWSGTTVGEDIQAFSDFLFFVLSGSNVRPSKPRPSSPPHPASP